MRILYFCSWYRFLSFVYAAIIHKRLSDMWDFHLQNEKFCPVGFDKRKPETRYEKRTCASEVRKSVLRGINQANSPISQYITP